MLVMFIKDCTVCPLLCVLSFFIEVPLYTFYTVINILMPFTWYRPFEGKMLQFFGFKSLHFITQ